MPQTVSVTLTRDELMVCGGECGRRAGSWRVLEKGEMEKCARFFSNNAVQELVCNTTE
jgi:hypothetical protein